MTARAIGAGRLFIFPMTIEARIMCSWRCLEHARGGRKSIGAPRRRYVNEAVVRRMTDRAVVVVRFFLIRARNERGSDESWRSSPSVTVGAFIQLEKSTAK